MCVCPVVSSCLRPHGLYSPPGSSVHGVFWARILEQVAISWPRNRTQVPWASCISRQILYYCVTWEAHNLSRMGYIVDTIFQRCSAIVLLFLQSIQRNWCLENALWWAAFWLWASLGVFGAGKKKKNFVSVLKLSGHWFLPFLLVISVTERDRKPFQVNFCYFLILQS